jgi:hypothetical protein
MAAFERGEQGVRDVTTSGGDVEVGHSHIVSGNRANRRSGRSSVSNTPGPVA